MFLKMKTKLMTKQEAIQEQIDQIMDTFDFAEVKRCMKAVGWTWDSDEPPDEMELRRKARELLKQCATEGSKSRCTCSTSNGGFTAMYVEEEGKEGKWLRMDLYFGYLSLNDGTLYDR